MQLHELIFNAPYSMTPWEAEAYRYLNIYNQCKGDLEMAKLDIDREIYNPPLTWEEIKSLDGKPIWIEEDCGRVETQDGKPVWIKEKCEKYWAFVELAKDPDIIFVYKKGLDYPEDLWKIALGRFWNAYRKERDNEVA